MKEMQLSIEVLRKLYNAALDFKKIECWDWMLDSDLFGVQNPANNEIGYCCVMGNLGEHFALAVYLGSEGLDTYLKVQSGEISGGGFEVFTSQKCLMASFEDRQMLTDEDRESVQKLNLKFRGRNQWPLFRSYRPGYYPWYLTEDEAEYLTLVLQQAVGVALRFKEAPDMLTSGKKDHYLIRVPEKKEDGLIWTDKWLKPETLEKFTLKNPPINEIRIQRVKKTVKRKSGIWQADFFFSPTPVKEKTDDRPYYPYAVLYVDSYSGLILHVDMLKPNEHITGFPNGLVELIEKTGSKPGEILVKRNEAYELLKFITDRLDINLRIVKRLEMLEKVQESMFRFLS